MNIIAKSLLGLSLGACIALGSAAEGDNKKVDVKDLPPAVAASLAKIGEVKSVHEHQHEGKVVYKAEIKVGDKTEHVTVNDKGEVVKESGKDGDKKDDKAAAPAK